MHPTNHLGLLHSTKVLCGFTHVHLVESAGALSGRDQRFLMAIFQNHVNIPFISDTGTIPPESCVFSQVLNIGAFLFIVMAYVRYRQVRFVQEANDVNVLKKWNILGLILGSLASVGLNIVGNYQETSILYIHLIGAAMTFGCGSLYMSVQTGISYYFKRLFDKHKKVVISTGLIYFKIFLSVSCCLLMAVAGVCLILALIEFKGRSIPCWTEEDGGFVYKLITTFIEWYLTGCFFCYIFTMANEYKWIEYEEIRFKTKLPLELRIAKKTGEYSNAQ